MHYKFPILRQQTTRLLLIGGFIMLAMLVINVIAPQPKASAADTSTFDPGNIIADSIFYNSSTMSVSDIQSFLNSHIGWYSGTTGPVPSCDTNHAGFTGSSGTVYNPQWICLKDFYENPNSTYSVNFTYKNTSGNTQTSSRTYYSNNDYQYTSLTPVYKNNDYTQGVDHLVATIQNVNGVVPSGAISAAQIIYNTAQQYGINPQVLIVLLQKEQGLVTDTWPYPGQYQSATGYGCPDLNPCSSNYAGFSNQLANAAWQFKQYQANPSNFNYVAGTNNTILWNPNTSCGSSSVYIQGQATAGLYNYTPYRPNAAALAAGYGNGDSCSSYGNRNFWLYFNDWFGSSTIQVLSPFADKYAALGGASGNLGNPTINQVCGSKDGGCYQIFQNGVSMYWSSNSGTHTIAGGIRAKWAASGSEWGVLGYPTSDEMYGNKDGGAYQIFQGGRIYYLNNGQSFIVLNSIYGEWSQLGSDWGKLGNPTTDTICGIRNSGCYQIFQDGSSIYWSSDSGAHTITGGIRAKWAANRGEWSQLGYPISDELYGTSDGSAYQLFQGGRLYYTTSGYAFMMDTNIYTKWTQMNAGLGILGYPTNDSFCGLRYGGCYQIFQNGATIYWTSTTGAHVIGNGIHSKWASVGSEWSNLGYPTSDELYNADGAYQTFQSGTIYWPFNAPSSIVYN